MYLVLGKELNAGAKWANVHIIGPFDGIKDQIEV